MTQIKFNNLPRAERKLVFQEISNQTGLPDYAVEKDWWVVQTLRVIFAMELAPSVVFKGGTSLSKAWGIIERFSEDIDLALDRSFLGFEKELSKSQVSKLRKKSYQYISKEFYPVLQEAFINSGFSDLRFNLRESESSDQDPLIIEIYYPAVAKHSKYVEPRILVEMGSRSLMEPNSKRKISSLVSEYFDDKEFADAPIEVMAVNPERTFLEKVFLLHEEFQKPIDKIRVNRLSRHLYDIVRLLSTEYTEEALGNKALYQDIVNHRKSITALRGIDYNLHQPQTLNPIPPHEVLDAWENDYRVMCETMIYGDKLSFDDLMNRIKELKSRINHLGWTIDMI